MADPKKPNPTAKDNEDLDREYDLQTASGQRSQTDAADGIGASTTGQAGRGPDDAIGDTTRLRDNDDSADLDLESDLEDDEVEDG